ATSIAWGPWAEVGMAARAGLDWSARGMASIEPGMGADLTLRLAADEAVVPAVLPIDWSRFAARGAEGGVLPFFRLVAQESTPAAAAASVEWVRELERSPAPERQRQLEKMLAAEV